jgi:hypothetical protein
MNAFEELVAGLLRQCGYWTHLNYKVKLSKDDKRSLDKPSLPRPELDILAYRPATNTLLWVECKSFLDSGGVHIGAFNGENPDGAQRYKVFTNPRYRELVSWSLIQQVLEEGLALPDPSLQYCLVAGRVHPHSREALHDHFEKNGWLFYDDIWLRDELKKLAKLGYEDDLAIMVAKLFEKS